MINKLLIFRPGTLIRIPRSAGSWFLLRVRVSWATFTVPGGWAGLDRRRWGERHWTGRATVLVQSVRQHGGIL